ncbi:MAG: hypothetical protein ACXVB9_10865 [Bdellovibrionota bacterium]
MKFHIAVITAFCLTALAPSASAGGYSCETPPAGGKAEPKAKVELKGGKLDQRNISQDLPVGESGTDGGKDYVSILNKALVEAGAQKVVCSSAYRTPEEQAAACKSICHGAASCPGLCAAPCHSQHQKKVAVCDFDGGWKSATEGCQALKKICDSKFEGKCGIGAYGGDHYHFGVNDTHFSSWGPGCNGMNGANAKGSDTVARAKNQK